MTIVRTPWQSRLRESILIVFSIFLCPLTLKAQNVLPSKDLVFGQVAAGDGYQSVLTLSNRGYGTYNGTMRFFKGQGELWNLSVNGARVTDGQIAISVEPGHTSSFTLTRQASLESGLAIIKSLDLTQNNSIGGNLTYFAYSGSELLDSVGVTPSTEFLIAGLPFDDFATIGFALANADPGRTASIRLRLFSETSRQIGSVSMNLAPSSHTA